MSSSLTQQGGCSRILLLGGAGAPLMARLREWLEKGGLEVREWEDNRADSEWGAVAAVLDLDSPGAAKLLARVRAARPGLHVVGVFEKADLQHLLEVAQGGLESVDGPAPSSGRLLGLLGRWTSPPDKAAPRSARSRATAEGGLGGGLVPAKRLSPVSPANQRLLGALVRSRTSRMLRVRCRTGSEVGLLAREFAHVCGLPEASVHSAPGNPCEGPLLLVTRDPGDSRIGRADKVLLVAEVEAGGNQGSGPMELEIEPLGTRPGDVSFYARAWLPVVAAAVGVDEGEALRGAILRRPSLLAHSWPGEFAELLQALRTIALCGTRGRGLPVDCEAEAETFEALASRAAPASFRALIEPRVPAHLCATVLSALGYPAEGPS